MSVEADFVADCTTSIDCLFEKWFGEQRPKAPVVLSRPKAVFTFPKEMNHFVIFSLVALSVAITVLLAVPVMRLWGGC